MKVGDLVWHIDDVKDGCATPGIVTALYDDDLTRAEEVRVLFTDRGCNEVHPKYELMDNLDDV